MILMNNLYSTMESDNEQNSLVEKNIIREVNRDKGK